MVAILMSHNTLLNVNDLQISYFLRNRVAKAVDGVDFIINKGETLGLTGESGSGKSTIARSIFNLIFPPGKIVGGEIWYKDRDLLKLSPLDLNTVRGEELALIPQDPIAAMDPILTSGIQSGEILEKDQEITMLESRFPSFTKTVHKKMVQAARDVRASFNQGELMITWSTRKLIDFYNLIPVLGPKTALDAVLLNWFDVTDKPLVQVMLDRNGIDQLINKGLGLSDINTKKQKNNK